MLGRILHFEDSESDVSLEEFGESDGRVVFRVAGLLKKDCFCSECHGHFDDGFAFIREVVNDIPILYCSKCACDFELHANVCIICHENVVKPIKFSDHCVLHKECLHCFQCALANSNQNNFTLVDNGNRECIICNDCYNINKKQYGNVSRNVVGKFIDQNGIPTKCDQCLGPFHNDVFCFIDGRLMCAKCGKNK